jgi:hypothetical protein
VGFAQGSGDIVWGVSRLGEVVATALTPLFRASLTPHRSNAPEQRTLESAIYSRQFAEAFPCAYSLARTYQATGRYGGGERERERERTPNTTHSDEIVRGDGVVFYLLRRPRVDILTTD